MSEIKSEKVFNAMARICIDCGKDCVDQKMYKGRCWYCLMEYVSDMLVDSFGSSSEEV